MASIFERRHLVSSLVEKGADDDDDVNDVSQQLASVGGADDVSEGRATYLHGASPSSPIQLLPTPKSVLRQKTVEETDGSATSERRKPKIRVSNGISTFCSNIVSLAETIQ